MTLQKPEETGKKESPTARQREGWRQRNDEFHSRLGGEGRLPRMGGAGSRKGPFQTNATIAELETASLVTAL